MKGEFELPAEHEDVDGGRQPDGGAAEQGRRRRLRVHRQQPHRQRHHVYVANRRA